ncbi:MAG: biotin/lipoyl-binding protein [Chloroflexi bacterium]|nr:biotin/lipoyl-binding protein [Chloroflexota bacterium]
MKYITAVDNQDYEIEINQEDQILVNGERRVVDFHGGPQGVFSLIIDNQSYEAVIEEREGKYHVLIAGDLYEVNVTDERALRLAQATGGLVSASGEAAIYSPMPGLIVDVLVEEGQEVLEGQTLVILESMKMQNELKAPRAGVVHRVSVHAGDNIGHNKLMVSIT